VSEDVDTIGLWLLVEATTRENVERRMRTEDSMTIILRMARVYLRIAMQAAGCL
jgi:hypothetical protein